MGRIGRRVAFTCPHCRKPLRQHRSENLKDAILEIVSDNTEIDIKKICGEDRHRNIVFARHLSMVMLYDYWMRSVTVVAKVFDMDHTSVLWGLRKIQDLSETEPETKLLVDAVRFQVQQHVKLMHTSVN